MHLPRGTYTIEPFARKSGDDHVLCTGPMSTCHVELPPTELYRGSVVLDPQVTLERLDRV